MSFNRLVDSAINSIVLDMFDFTERNPDWRELDTSDEDYENQVDNELSWGNQ